MNNQEAINWSQKSHKNKEQDDKNVLSLGSLKEESTICENMGFRKRNQFIKQEFMNSVTEWRIIQKVLFKKIFRK